LRLDPQPGAVLLLRGDSQICDCPPHTNCIPPFAVCIRAARTELRGARREIEPVRQ
jgi:hypothetical protein